MNINKLKKMINSVQVVSFDIFDTLLLRTYIKPIDLFYHLEKMYKIDGFAQKRIEAENIARLKKEEVTIYEIYAELPLYAYMMENEIALEIKNLHTNKEMLEIYKYARQKGKKVVITSDMYLSYDVVKNLLIKNGYSDFSKLYLSNVYGKTKSTGKLFDVLLDDLKVSPKKVLHIGDNYNIDYLSSIKKKIKAFHYKSVVSRYLNKHKNLKKFFKCNKNPELSVVMALSAENEIFFNDYWYNIGFSYGGIVATSYIDFIKTELKQNDIEDIAFVARDGYTLKRIFDKTKPKQNSYYIYASRALKQPKYENDFKQYLKQYGFNSKTAIVETVSANFTAQKMIEKAIGQEVLGFYIALDKEAGSGKLKARKQVFNKITNDILFKEWDFIEFLLSAPELPICAMVDNKLIYKQNAPWCEHYRKEIYQGISNGICDFNSTLRTFFTVEELSFQLLSVVDWIDYFSDNPGSLDRKYFKKIYHATDEEHSHYSRLFKGWYKLFKGWYKNLFKRLVQKIFSSKNSYNRKHKILTILGFKIKFKRK